ncbi:MAG: hypothetical protein J3Q66DRAFT_438424 [Benniella sp.]|nr:MAG: hypothetical protein J3Q66DRAFT_438424 [Benniella sp.]
MLRQSLPLECVLIILGFLSEDYDTDTMASLLCVSRTICALTLPFLYGDCFKSDMHRCRPRSKKTVITSVHQLVCTLLMQVYPQDQIPSFLQVAYLSQDDSNDLQANAEHPTPVFQYRSFLRKLAPGNALRCCLYDIHRSFYIMDDEANNRLYDRYVADGVIINVRDPYKSTALVHALKVDTYQQLIWILCQGYMDSIEELSIPLSDIERYIDHVDQFKTLSKVNFTVDKETNIPHYMHTYIPPDEYGQRRDEMEGDRERLFMAMVRFVKRHTSIHHHVLRHVVLPDEALFPEIRRYSTVDVWFAIQLCLPPPQNLRQINRNNLYNVVVRQSEINLSHVESIMLDPAVDNPARVFKIWDSRTPFLSRCRALKNLNMGTLGSDMFQWAVLEKKQKDAVQQQQSVAGRQLSSWQHSHQDLVPLQSIKITHNTPLTPVQELNDIVFAFSDSLEDLTVCEEWDFDRMISTDLRTSSQVVHGRDWNLPHIRYLQVEVQYSQLQFDLDALQRFRALELLYLEDRIAIYDHRDIRSWPPLNHPHLKRLVLNGSPALFFNLDSLHHLPCLDELELGTLGSIDGHYIPSPEEMCEDSQTQDQQAATANGHELSGTPGSSQGYQSIGKRPRFTWDWYLPIVQDLELRAAFAYKFDFQWLQHLPNLHSFSLNSSSTQQAIHERSLTLNDLSRGPQQQQDEDEGKITSDQYLSSPTLETIVLKGHWSFDAKVLEVFCLVVAPNLRRVHFGPACGGHSLLEWVVVARRMPCLEQSRLDRQFTISEIHELGLSTTNLQDEYPNKRHLKHILHEREYWDVLDS